MIERIHIQNFKSIRDVSVDLSPVAVLIGRSGVGKSNFLRAIRFLRNSLLDADAAASIEGGWDRIFPFGTRSVLSISVRFSIPGYDERFLYEVSWSKHPNHGGIIPGSERLRLGDDVIFGWSGQQWEVRPESGLSANVETNLHLGSFPTNSEAVLAFTALTSGIGWHDFPANVFSGPEQAPQQSGQLPGPSSQGLDDSAHNYLEVLRNLTQNLQSQHSRRQILSRVKQINPSVASIELDSILNPQGVVVTHRVSDQRIPLSLSQESDGFRRYFAHLLALYQTPPKQVLMFEEPENGIYPGALRNLAEEFRAAAPNGRGQVLMTTQSPELLDGFDPESIRVVDVDETQSTQIGPLAADQLQAVKDKLLDTGELITVDQPRSAGVSA